jgi:hypothetical protein
MAGELTGSILLELLPRKKCSARDTSSRAVARRNRNAAEELPGTAKLLGMESQVSYLPQVKLHGGRSARASRSDHCVGLIKAQSSGPELPPSGRQQVQT